ncbi:MAG: fibronectin type III domain-containing protein [Bacteroidales bacterium]|nr:fibronectin type III domain-containing protein [Bacteroidales bacterium]
MKKLDFLKSVVVMMLTMLMTVTSALAQYAGTGTFAQVSSAEDLTTGYYVITDQTGAYALTNEVSSNNVFLLSTDAVFTNPSVDNVWYVTVATDGTITMYNEAVEKYVVYLGSGNSANLTETVTDNARWTASLDANNNWVVENEGVSGRFLSYNAGSPRFACYGNNGQQELAFYKLQEAGALAAPQFSTAGGFQYEAFDLTLTAATGASIYYTLDGTTPTTSSTLYSTPIAINSTTTVNAIAVLDGEESSVATAVYSFPVVATIADFRANGTSNVVYDIANCTFVFRSGSYAFVKDVTGGLCVYGNNALSSFEEGDVIPHIYGTRSVFSGMVELVPTHESPAATLNLGAQSPVVVTADDILNNYSTYEGQLVKMTNVTFTGNRQFVPAERNSVSFSQNGSDNLYIYDAFKVLSANVVSGQTADVVGFVSIHNSQKQLFCRNNADIMLNEVAVPFTDNFDGAANYWHFVQDDQANMWYRAQGTGFDSQALFVSDNGYSNKYDVSNSSVSHAYIDVIVPTTGMVIGCDYRVGGEGSGSYPYDYMTVSVIDPEDELEAGEELTANIAQVNLTNGWQHANFAVSGESTETVKRVVLTWTNDNSGGTQPAAAIDNLTITAGSCMPVANLTVSDIDAESAVVAWDNASDVTWQVEYKTAEETDWTIVSALANTVTLTGLTSNTEYDVRVKTVCSSTESSDYVATTFTTMTVCGAPENVTVTPAAYTAEIEWTVTPHTTYDVEFKEATATEWVTLVTGVSAVPVTLGGLTTTTDYQVRVIAHCSVDNGTATSEVVSFTTTERCPAPVDLAAAIDGNTLNVTWTSDDYFGRWILQYKDASTDYWSSEVALTEPHYTISPVQTATSYQIKVKSICEHGTLESDYSEISVAVPCANAGDDVDLVVGTGTSTGYYAPFNNYYKNSWNEEIFLADEIGTSGIINSISYEVATASSLDCSHINIYMGHTSKTEYADSYDWTPMSDLTLVYSADNVTIGANAGWETYTLNTPFNYNGSDNLVVVVTHNADSYSNSLKYKYTSKTNRCLYRQSDSYTNYSEHPGTGSGTRSSYVANIQLNITECGDATLCEAPTNITVTNVTSTSAHVAWEGNAASYIVKVVGPDAEETYAGITGNTYDLTNLAPNQTSYTVTVAAQCGENLFSSNGTAVTFETECENLAIPYFTNFDTYTGTTSSTTNILPTCWSQINEGTTYTGYPTTYNSSSYAASGSNSLRFYTYSSSSYGDNYAILPYTDVAVNTLMVNLDARQYSTSTTYRSELEVGVMTDPTDASTFETVETIILNATTYNNYNIYFDEYEGNGHYIALRAAKPTSSPNYNVVYVDNLTVDYIPSCSAPTITDYNLTSKELTWTNGEIGTPQSYEVICNANGATTNTFTFTTTTGLLLGLQGLTDYEVYVRSICGEGDTSAWSDPYYFTTPESGCMDPADVVATTNTNLDVIVSWTADPEQNAWAVSYKTDNDPVWSAPIAVTGTPTVTISGLQTATLYTIRVNAVCNGGASQSDYAYGSVYVPCSTGAAAADVTVGTGTSTTYNAPFNNFYKNSRNEVIYLASELGGQAGAITSISYDVATSANFTTTSVNIYMGHTTESTFSSTTDWTSPSDLTLVYSSTGEAIGASTGWNTFNFDTPFNYNGTDNVVVVVTKTCSSYNSSLNFRYTSNSNRLLYRQSDSNTGYADINNTTQSGTRSSYVPNAKFSIVPPCDDPALCAAVVDNVTVTPTNNSATVTWTATGADSYVVEYALGSLTVGEGTQMTTTGTSIELTGLDENEDYTVAVYPLCANGNFGTYASAEFTTTTGGDTPAEPDVVVMGETTFITTCDAMIYDNGGPTGDYESDSYETLDITPATAGASLHITGTYDMEDDYDYVYIYDAEGATIASLTGEGTVDVTIPGSASILLDADYSYNLSGFAFHVECITPVIPDVPADEYILGEVASITTCNAVIYDDGGATGNYSTSFDESMLITPSTTGAHLHITGTYDMETNWDKIYIYDGDNTLLQTLTGSGSVDLEINGPAIVRLTSDGSVCYSGFAFNVSCIIPETISTELVSAYGLSNGCDLSGQYITAEVSNIGLDAITSLTGSYSVNGGAAVTETFAVNMAAGENAIVTFTTPVVFDQATNSVEVTLYATNEPSTMWTDNVATISGISTVAPLTAPYAVLPTTASSLADGWRIIDAANNGLAWTIGSAVLNAPYSDEYDNNNWIITPCYDLTAGKYMVTYDYKVNNAFVPESFAVYYGNGATVANMTNVLGQHANVANTSYVTASHVIDITADGNYNFGFLANSNRGGLGMSVKNLTIVPMVTMYASANGNGTVTPNGTIVAEEGATQTFVMNPDAHYYLNNVTVNGEVVATYNNVAGAVVYNHTVAANDVLVANFSSANLFTYNVVAGQGYVNGGFYTAPATFTEDYATGQDIHISFVADAGYHVANVNINGVDYGAITDWVILGCAQDYTFTITFAPNTYVVTTTAYGNGTVSDGATFVYDPANTYTFVATPGANAHIASILRNNEEIPVADPFSAYTETLTNILSDYNYVVRFDPNYYAVVASAGNNGTITPDGTSYYAYNTNATYGINAANGYYIASITVDDVTTDYTQANALTSMTYNFPNISADHSISATFAQYEYTITVNAGENGTITPATITVGENATPTFTITPDAGYGIADVTVDGVSVGAVASYTFAPVSANHTIAATFSQYQYTINATAGNGGTITPSGVTNMVYNGDQTYTITPNAGYSIADVYVDGASVGAVSTYTFTDVTANHTIYAAFDINEYTVTVTQPANGTITPGTTTVQYGATPSFMITPNTGFNVTAITLNGTNVISTTPQVNGVYTLTLPAVTANATLTATMTAKTYTITASAGANGTITPSGVATVNFGENKSYTFAPAAGYEIANVTVDGLNMGAITSYTFVNVVANHTINVTFQLLECEVPTNLQTIFIDTTSATLSWYHAGAVSYDIQYKASDETTFTTTNTTSTTYNLTGLTPGTTYTWMVRANCVANNPSEWTNGCTFRTLDVFENHDGIEDHVQSMINVYSESNNVYIVNENGINIENVQIYDVYGKLLYSGHVNSTREVISMNVANGTYLVRLATEYGNCNYKLHLTR